MSHTIIYGYFRNKQSLFEALKIEMLKILQDFMVGGDDPNADPLQRLRNAAHSLLRYARSYPNHYQFLFSSPVSKESGRETLQTRHTVFDFVVELAVLASKNESTLLEPRTLANLSWATLHGLIMLDLSNQLREGRALEDLLEAALELLFMTPGDSLD